MDHEKKSRLVTKLASQSEPQIVSIDVFFDGNDDSGSIGCNLLEHPGVEAFKSAFEKISNRQDVEAIYAQIAEIDPGEDSWPFTDTVIVFGSISVESLSKELLHLEPDDIGKAKDFGVSATTCSLHSSPALAVWWD